MARRAFIAALTAVYALQASWVLYAGVDALAPAVAVAVKAPSADAGCCASSCGCPAGVRARKACCCDPKAAQAPAPAPSGRFSAFEAARCAGVEAAMAQARTQPVLPSIPLLCFLPVVEAAPVAPDALPAAPLEASCLDKVPIL